MARTLGISLKIAAKVDKADEAYFREKIAPLLNDPGVEFIGEINERSKAEFLGEAQALLFPIDWPEPFGLVMIEAMACGTPVLAFRHGSVSEIIDQGVTGAIVDTMDEAVMMLPRVIGSIAAPCGAGSSNDFRPRAWPRTMLRSTVRCSSGRPYRSARGSCRCHDRYWKRS